MSGQLPIVWFYIIVRNLLQVSPLKNYFHLVNMEPLTPKFKLCVGYKTIQPAQKNCAQQGKILDKTEV